MAYAAGQQVRIKADGSVGKVFLKLPLRDVYLVQFPGFPVVEKVYNGSDLEPFTPAAAPEVEIEAEAELHPTSS